MQLWIIILKENQVLFYVIQSSGGYIIAMLICGPVPRSNPVICNAAACHLEFRPSSGDVVVTQSHWIRSRLL